MLKKPDEHIESCKDTLFFHSWVICLFFTKNSNTRNSNFWVPYARIFSILKMLAGCLKHSFGFSIEPTKRSQKFQKDADQQVFHVSFHQSQINCVFWQYFHPSILCAFAGLWFTSSEDKLVQVNCSGTKLTFWNYEKHETIFNFWNTKWNFSVTKWALWKYRRLNRIFIQALDKHWIKASRKEKLGRWYL